MPEKFKWGIIGPGRIAQKFADTVQKIPDGKIHAIASRSSENLEKLKRDMHAETAYQSYQELVKDAEVDAIYIATPHRFHYENALLCLENGKPALVEKAFTTNSREAEQLIKTAKNNNLLLMEAMWTRYMPILQDVKQWIEKGKIGQVQLVLSTLGFKAKRDPQDRLLNLNLAGGTILDLGVYTLGISQFFFPDYPQSVQSGHTDSLLPAGTGGNHRPHLRPGRPADSHAQTGKVGGWPASGGMGRSERRGQRSPERRVPGRTHGWEFPSGEENAAPAVAGNSPSHLASP